MEKLLLRISFLIAVICLVHMTTALAQTPAPGVAAFSNQGTIAINTGYSTYSGYVPTGLVQDLGQGYEFVAHGTGAAAGGHGPYLVVGTYNNGGTDGMISFTQTSTAQVTEVYIQSAPTGAPTYNQDGTTLPGAGGEFKFTSIKLLAVSGSSTVYVQAYSNGVAVGSPVSHTVDASAKVLFDFSTNPDFYNIDQIKITGFGTAGIRADDLTTAVAVTAPTISVGVTGNPGCGAGSVTLTASGGTPTGGTYSWYNALSTLSPDPVLATGTSFNPIVSGSYYAVYTKGATTITSANTAVTINPIVSSPVPNAVFSYPFTGNAKDISGNQNDGLPQNAPTFTTDRYGAANAAYNFDGTNQFIETTSPNGNPQTFTISLWFNTTTTTGGRLAGFSQYQTGGGSFDRHIYMVNGGQLYFGVYSGGTHTLTTANSYNDGTWHHVVGTLSSAGMKLYVDNVLQDSNTLYTAAEPQTNGYWEIGGNNLNGWAGVTGTTSNYFKGVIDDVSVYSTELSAATITSLNDINQIGAYAPVCPGTPLTIYCPTITGATYSWTGPNGMTATGQNPTFASAAAGNYIVTVTGGPGGCSSTATFVPAFYTIPTATFTATPTVNIGANAAITLTSTYDATLTYSWDFNGGSPATNTGKGPFSVSWTTAGVKTITLTITNANGCIGTITQTVVVGSTAWYSNYVFRKKILLDKTKISGTASLTNFPVLLKIVDPDLIYVAGSCTNKIQSSTLSDLAFTDATTGQTVELPYQIDNYDSTTNTLLVWVQIPSLNASGAGTAIYYYFGSNAPVAHFAATSTWGSDYQGVYHFNESSFSATTGAIKDATTNARNATALTANATTSTLAAGQVSNGYTFAGAQKISTAVTVNFASTFTLSAWVKPALLTNVKIMSNQTAANIGYELGFYNNILESEAGGSSTRGFNAPTGTPIVANNWYYVQTVYTGTALSTYVNGILNSSIALSTNTPTTTMPFSIGVGEGGNMFYFSGTIDEVRTSNVAKTSDWLLTEYNNQLNPTSIGTAPFISSITANEWSPTNFAAGYAPGSVIYTWTGGTSTNPTVAGNWNNTTMGITSQVPYAIYSSLSVPNVTTKPVLTAALSAYSLTLSAGTTFNLSGQTLSIGCNIYNNANTVGTGILDGGSAASGITWSGKLATQTYTGTNTVNTAQLGNLTINNTSSGTVTITGGPVDMTNLLTLTQGNLVIDNTNNGALTLKANTTTNTLSYAQIGTIVSPYTIKGSINYQVYFTGGAGWRNYRAMGSPIYDFPTTYSATNGTYKYSNLKNSFIITGPGGPSNGFDASYNYGATLKTWNPASNNYSYVSTLSPTSPTVPTGTGFYMYFRGDRINKPGATTTDPFGSKTNKANGGGSFAPPEPVLYTYTGIPNQGDVSIAFGATDTRYYFISNPYAATLDATALIASTVIGATRYMNTKIWVWKPSASAKYAIWDSADPTASPNGANTSIIPGQGFFIQANTTGTARTLKITESMKTPGSNANTFRNLSAGAPSTTPEPPILRLQLTKNTYTNDEIGMVFRDDTKAILDPEDAVHFEGDNITLSSLSADNNYLAIDKRPFTGSRTVVPLYVTAAADSTYSLHLSYKSDVMENYKMTLYDSLLNTNNVISKNAYLFQIANEQAGTYGKRIKLIIEPDPAPTLFTDFTGKLDELKKVLLNWNGTNDRSNITYQVQRSTDKKVFINVGDPLPSLSDNQKIDYQAIDSNPQVGINYYRLIQTDLFHNSVYSDTVLIANNPGLLDGIAKNGFLLYSNPVKDVVSIVSDKSYQGTVKLQIYDNQGQVQASQSFIGMDAQVAIQKNISNLRMGVYTAHIENDNKELVVIKFIKN